MSDDTTTDATNDDRIPPSSELLIDPETGWNRLMVDQMARSIQVMHEILPNAWCIHSWENEPIVAVASMNIGSVGPTVPHGLIVSTVNLDQQQTQLVETYSDNTRVFAERPWAAYLRIPEDHVRRVLVLLGDAHATAVKRLAGQVTSRANRWKSHRDDFRKEFERIARVSIPEPGYIRELTGILESSASIETMGPFDGIRSELLERMAQDIRSAHDANLNAWALFRLQKGGVVLSVESVTAVYLTKMGGSWILMGSLDDSRFASIQDEKITGRYKDFPGFLVGVSSQAKLVSISGDFQSEHERAIEHLANLVKVRTNRALEHQPATLQALEQALGIDLPRPGYEKDILTLRASAERLAGYFADSGLQYGASQVASFYTALQTKGFVVLSGISGTGKSKIAQGFVDFLPDGLQSPAGKASGSPLPEQASDGIRDGWIYRKVHDYVPNGTGLILPLRQFGSYPLPAASESQEVSVSFAGAESVCLLQNDDNPNRRVIKLEFRDSVLERTRSLVPGEQLRFRVHLNDTEDRIESLEMERVRPMHLATTDVNVENHLFLSVRPDWRDSTSLLGYFNPLTQTYEWTDFLRFILRAVESYRAADGLAWFVILDEMNLAHVEYYFADLLSVLESGRRSGPDDDLAGFTREPLRTTYPDTLDDEVPPREIHLPPNLYIIGTVNMDETTHAFSPKVLDRAFTIDLTDVSFENYPPPVDNDAATDLPDGEKQALLAAFTRDQRFHGVDKVEVAQAVAIHPEIRDWLDELNRVLMKDRFHFGYRIFDEICQYIVNNDLNRMMSFENAFDQAVFMKVLPKFSGSRARLRSPLISVLAWAIDPAEPLTKQVVTDLDSHLAGTSEALRTRTEAAAVPTVARRALEMLERVEQDGFVSFG